MAYREPSPDQALWDDETAGGYLVAQPPPIRRSVTSGALLSPSCGHCRAPLDMEATLKSTVFAPIAA